MLAGSLSKAVSVNDLLHWASVEDGGRDDMASWLHTEAMPVTIPGVLDLRIRYLAKPEGWEEAEWDEGFDEFMAELAIEPIQAKG